MQFPSEWSDRQATPSTTTALAGGKRRRITEPKQIIQTNPTIQTTQINLTTPKTNAIDRDEELKALLTQCETNLSQNPNPD
jgi:hypothetical protein